MGKTTVFDDIMSSYFIRMAGKRNLKFHSHFSFSMKLENSFVL